MTNDPDGKSTAPPLALGYARQPPVWRPDVTPERERRDARFMFTVLAGLTLFYWFSLFRNCTPSLELFCFGPFMSMILAVAWSVLGWEFVKVGRRDSPPPRRRRRRAWRLLTAVAFLLAPYALLRADNDMFALGVRYRLLCAGGAAKVQTEFNGWVASRPAGRGPNNDGEYLFRSNQAGNIVPIPSSQLPPAVRYIHEHIYSRFGLIWDGAAVLDNVAGINTADVTIGPPGWRPKDEVSLWEHIRGTHRMVADGIWIRVGYYNK